MKRGFKKKLIANKRKIAGIVAALLALLMLLSALSPFFSAYGATEAAFEIEGEFGFSQRYVVGGVTPVKIMIKNNGDDFKGEAQIKINVYNDASSALYNVYAYPVELPQGSSTVVEMNVVVPTVRTSHKITLVNEKEETVAQRTLKNVTAIDPESMLLATLTDNKNSLNYLRQIEAGESGALGNNVIALDEKSFPDTEEALANFDAICINDFDTGRLMLGQRTALEAWLKNGGILIVGTGQNFDKVMRGLEGVIPEVKQNGSRDITVPKAWMDERQETSGQTPIRVSLLQPDDAYTWEDEATGYVMTAMAPVDGGLVVLHSFDLGTAPIPVINERSGYLTAYYGELLGSGAMGYSAGNSYYRGTDYLVTNLPVQSGRIIAAVFVVIVVYGIFAGPCLYLILKKKDIREKGLIIVPGISVAVSLLILLLTSRGLYQNPIINTVNYVDVSDGAGIASAEINAGVFSPKKGNVKVDFSENMPISIADQYERYHYRSSSNQAAMKEENQSKILYGRAPSITYYDKASWDTNTFTTRVPVDLKSGLRGEFYLEGRRLKGDLVNETGLEIQDVIVGIGQTMQKYGTLLPGESLAVDQDIDLAQSSGMYTAVYNLLSQELDQALTGEEKRQINYKQNIISYFYESSAGYRAYGTYGNSKALAVAYAPTPVAASTGNGKAVRLAQNPLAVYVMGFNYDQLYGGRIKVNGRTPTVINTNFIMMQTTLNTNKMRSYDLPYEVIRCGYVQADVNFETYESEIYLYEAGDVEFAFTVPTQTKVSLIQFKWEPNAPEENREIWNTRTKSWETLSMTAYRENAGDYVDGEGAVRVRLRDVQEFVTIPSIRMQGGR